MEFLGAALTIVGVAPGVFITTHECTGAALILPACNPQDGGAEMHLLPFLEGIEANEQWA